MKNQGGPRKPAGEKRPEEHPSREEASGEGPPSREDLRRTIGTRLRAARTMAGLSQGQVARMIGIHRPSVSEAEAGRRRVPADELRQFAEIYGVRVDWLVGASPDSVDREDPRVQLAARELGKLKPEDLDRVFQLLAALRETQE